MFQIFWSPSLYKSYINGLLTLPRRSSLHGRSYWCLIFWITEVGFISVFWIPQPARKMLCFSVMRVMLCRLPHRWIFEQDVTYWMQPNQTLWLRLFHTNKVMQSRYIWRTVCFLLKIRVGTTRIANNVSDTDIADRISLASRCAYALMGSGQWHLG